jgi:hypothetical protein
MKSPPSAATACSARAKISGSMPGMSSLLSATLSLAMLARMPETESVNGPEESSAFQSAAIRLVF